MIQGRPRRLSFEFNKEVDGDDELDRGKPQIDIGASQADGSAPGAHADPAHPETFMKGFEPLEDGSVNPGEEGGVVERCLALLGDEYLASVRRSADMHLKLSKAYERVQNATQHELRAFARIWLEAILRGSGALESLAKLARGTEAGERTGRCLRRGRRLVAGSAPRARGESVPRRGAARANAKRIRRGRGHGTDI